MREWVCFLCPVNTDKVANGTRKQKKIFTQGWLQCMLAFAVGSVELLLAIKGARVKVFFFYYLVVYTTGQSYRAGGNGKGGVDKIQTWCFIVHDGAAGVCSHVVAGGWLCEPVCGFDCRHGRILYAVVCGCGCIVGGWVNGIHSFRSWSTGTGCSPVMESIWLDGWRGAHWSASRAY